MGASLIIFYLGVLVGGSLGILLTCFLVMAGEPQKDATGVNPGPGKEISKPHRG